jgi:hypothetical protein
VEEQPNAASRSAHSALRLRSIDMLDLQEQLGGLERILEP